MFCNKCGTQLPDDAKFCANCGNVTDNQAAQPQEQNVYAEAPQYQAAPTYQDATSYYAQPMAPVDDKSLMIKGIVAVALAEFGIPGIILGAMAKKQAQQFMAANGGRIFGKAKVGSILGRVGFGLGIGMTIFWAFYFIVIVGILGALGGM